MCPVAILQALFNVIPSNPDTPLSRTKAGVILTQSILRKQLSSILTFMHVPLTRVRFHTFRPSAATIAFDAKVPLQTLQMHGVWHSDAIWSYGQYIPLFTSSIGI